MTDRITKGNLEARAEQINRVLAEIGVDIDASISGANGGFSLVGDKGSRNISRTGHMPKRELYNQLNTTLQVLYEVSRQLRAENPTPKIIIEVADRDTAIGLLGNIEEHLDRTVDENETAKIIGTRIQ